MKKIFEQYGQSNQFEKCRKYLLNVLFDTMNEQIDWFNTLSTKNIRFCEKPSVLIAIQSERESINKFSIVTHKTKNLIQNTELIERT